MSWPAFEQFSARKTREAAAAQIERLTTVFDRSEHQPVRQIGNDWSRRLYDGPFNLLRPSEGASAVSLVFVQSKNGNTGGADPGALGGGATDKHFIYEGLTRVAADAVLAGAGSVPADAVWSVWHPELVALRASLNLPRHPAQIVLSSHARVDFDALMFNVPALRVFVIALDEHMPRHASALRARPWVKHVPLRAGDLRSAIDWLREQEGIRQICATGGRFTATRLVDAQLAPELFLTTTPFDGGEPNTPWYSGSNWPALETITRKQWIDNGSLILFDHKRIGSPML